MFNEYQQRHMEHLASLPPEAKSACGWYSREECDKGHGCGMCERRRPEKGMPPCDIVHLLRRDAQRLYRWDYPSPTRPEDGHKNLSPWKAADHIEALRGALRDLLRISTWDGEFTTREEYEPVAERALALLRDSTVKPE
ncbi:hypothetical protein [Microvirga arsenatis]|uniref:HEPN domain-containing protein n=1 Tax=Microvirga arsenatis TaxID=2692265 RepID=A0ABW9Z144_9HYPH|nr:hypothetical protein [Microvirga arsenatis]NBJ12180.1 hypothetical protein [Microvirga arsenatis]NBJ25832.1 hypothetical protein [Microvirga arsenatis]